MVVNHLPGIVAALLAAVALPGESSAQAPAPSQQPGLTYADVADLALAQPVAAHVRIDSAVPLEGARAAGVPAGFTRFYVSANVVSAIRAPGPLSPRLAYLVDVANAGGRAPKLRRKAEYIVVGNAVAGRPGELRLADPDSQLPYTPALAERVRTILREAAAPGAAPAITGIGRAFHVPGAIQGEGETQFFLLASGGRPVSITVVRRPGETPLWGVALSEIVDDSAAAPQPDTLLWYRLACTLPAALPPQSLAEASPDQIAAIQTDWRFVKQSLGACRRSRARS